MSKTAAASQSQNDLEALASEESPILHRVEVRIGARRVGKAFDRAYKDLAKNAHVKGFRRGKTPRKVLERMYGPSVAEELERTLVQETLADAIEQTELQPVATPSIEAEPPSPGDDFTYVAKVEVKPAISLPDLAGLAATKPKVEVEVGFVDNELEQLRVRQAVLVEEPEGTVAAEGHVLRIDFVGRIGDEAFQGGSGEGVELEIGSGQFIPGFEEQLVGSKAGDDTVVTVTFPEDYGNAELAGKEAAFETRVVEVKRRDLPELDDEFAKDVGDFDTLDALRDRIHDDKLAELESGAKTELRRTLVDSLIERAEFDVPPGLVEQELEQQLRRAAGQLQQSFPEDVLRQQIGQWQEEWRPAAERQVREALLLEAVAQAEGLEVPSEALEAEIEKVASSQGTTADQLREAVGSEALEGFASRQLLDEQAIEFLAAKAKVEELTDT